MFQNQTFPGNPSRTDINILSSSLSLFEDMYSIIDRTLVFYDDPLEFSRKKFEKPEEYVACGKVELTEGHEVPTRSIERDVFGLERLERFEFGYLDGEKTWENVRHPQFGGFSGKNPTNLNLEGVEKPDLTPDSLSLKSAVPTNKSKFVPKLRHWKKPSNLNKNLNISVWKTGYTYEYEYKGFIATGMFGLSPKVAGGSMEGRVYVEAVDENTLNIAVSDVQLQQKLIEFKLTF